MKTLKLLYGQVCARRNQGLQPTASTHPCEKAQPNLQVMAPHPLVAQLLLMEAVKMEPLHAVLEKQCVYYRFKP